MFCALIDPAVKILSKHHIVKEKKVPYVKREREVLLKINHPFFVKLYFTFQDKENLCILDNSHCVIGTAITHTHKHKHSQWVKYWCVYKLTIYFLDCENKIMDSAWPKRANYLTTLEE